MALYVISCRRVAKNTQILTILLYNMGPRPQKITQNSPKNGSLNHSLKDEMKPYNNVKYANNALGQSVIQKVQYFIFSNLETQNSIKKIRWAIVRGSLFQVKFLKLNFKETWNGV